jgi:multidrug efflux pump subunit AcrB
VVNDALILIDFINRAARSGVDIEKAVVESGKARFRPVLLTSITTIAGLLPILMETSFQAQFLIPMAVSICFGLLAATLLTLLFVPALYLIVRDVKNLVVTRFRHAEEGPQFARDSGQMSVNRDQIKEEIK